MPKRVLLPVVTYERPRCPQCAATDLPKFRSLADQGDGTAMWWVECAGCGHRFKVLLE